MAEQLAPPAHVHTIPVDPSLTIEEAWSEICIMGLRTTYTGDPTWANVRCDGQECSSVAAVAVADRHRFTDPITRTEVTLIVRDDVAGVEHPQCDHLADVSAELDAFYCTVCEWSGRIGGAWYASKVRARHG